MEHTTDLITTSNAISLAKAASHMAVDGRRGQFLLPEMIRVVTGNRSSFPDNGARPTSYNRDLAGACLVGNIQQGMVLNWSDIGTSCGQ